MKSRNPWKNPKDFFLKISTEFVSQLLDRVDSQNDLAEKLKVSKSAVSQKLHNPGNIKLETMVKYARALGLKLSVVLYEDIDDPNDEWGPIHADVFRMSWEDKKRPRDFRAFRDRGAANTPGNYERRNGTIFLREIAISAQLTNEDLPLNAERLDATGTT